MMETGATAERIGNAQTGRGSSQYQANCADRVGGYG